MRANDSKALQAAAWFRRLSEESNTAFLPLFFDEHKHLVLMGGGGSGKSIFAGRKIIERAATEKGHRFLVVRKVGRTLRDSCFAQLKSQALDCYKSQVKRIPEGRSEMYIKFKNGSEILFTGLDDAEKLKSIYNITGIWVEEATEITEADFNQLDIRLRGESPYYKQIILTFNPISVTHWLKKRFFDRKNDVRVRCMKTTYKDNRFLPEEDRQTLELFKMTDPYYYQVYALGMWGTLSQTIFAREKLMRRLTELKAPVAAGEFTYHYDGLTVTDIRFDENGQKDVMIYEKPVDGIPYVIGADTAGEGSDWFVAQVINNINGKLVAKYRVQTDEDLFARALYCLGKWYNTALIAIEVNFSTHPTKELERLRYPKLYMREVEDTITHKLRMSHGFKTDRITRPNIIAGLVEIAREHTQLLTDEETINEMLTFTRNAKGRPEAEQGAHDDCVMALAITYYVREQQTARPEIARAKAHWEKDMYEDYWSADEQQRALMLRDWGNPF